MCTAMDVINFWFGEFDEQGRCIENKSSLWWGKNDETDRLIKERFGRLLEEILQGGQTEWRQTPQGLLATIIVLDQFSRNIYRGKPAAFAGDELALTYTLNGLENGSDEALFPIQRVFFYLPLEHSEAMGMQKLSMVQFQKLLQAVDDQDKPTFQGFLDFAQKHYDVIVEFGRYPHRNSILGRDSTASEQAYLLKPGSGF